MKNTKLFAILVLIIFGMIFSHGAYAAQFVSGPNTYTVNLNKSTYAPGESIVANGSVTTPSNSNVPRLDVTINIATATVLKYNTIYPSGSVTMTAPSVAGTYSAIFSGSGSPTCVMQGWSRICTPANFVNYSVTYTVATPPAPTCTLAFSPVGPLTAPGSTTATWTSANTTSAKYSCTGPISATNVAIATSGSLPFNNMSAGTENCTITVTGPGGTGTCSKSIIINATPVNGSCGTANHIYASTATGWGADTACATGTASATLNATNFPAQGASYPWTCNGSSGGSTASCTGSRAPACVSTNCEAITCTGETCSDCRGIINGSKNCQRSLNWREVSPN
ncbi:MAG: hypothetical protein Q7T51_02240 [Candidatus Moranbacteria bacterium]|nr:hypothetical protein [Candidatus Moranbacteria bacterium]